MNIPEGFPFNQDKPLLQIEQELLDAGMTEDELSRFYPSFDNGQGPCPRYDLGCLCPRCDPADYYDYDGTDTQDSTPTTPPLLTGKVYIPPRDVSMDLSEIEDHPF